MLFVDFFLYTFLVSAISIVWFCTDWFIHYSQLFGFAENLRLKYTSYITKHSDKYFPDFLYTLTPTIESKILKFVLKLASCPFCLNFWISVGVCVFHPMLIAPVYVCSLFILLQIKKMM